MTEIDTLVGHSLGASVAMALEDKYRDDKIDIPGVGIKQVKTFGAPVVAGNLGGNNQLIKKVVVKGSEKLGSSIGTEIGVGLDAATGFTDEGLFTYGLSTAGGKIGSTIGTRLTTSKEDNPDRIRYAGDPISAFDFNAKTVVPSLGFRMNNSAHSYKGLSIPDKFPEHDLAKEALPIQPDDDNTKTITEYFCLYSII